MAISGRVSIGLRKPAPEPVRRADMSMDDIVRLLRPLRPYAAPRLPADVLACFDRKQRQIRPLPRQSSYQWAQRLKVRIPTQRRPDPSEQSEVQSARRR
jgi:hypothetical protein